MQNEPPKPSSPTESGRTDLVTLSLKALKVAPVDPPEVFVANVAKTRKRGLTGAHRLSEWRGGRPIAIVGGGPSLAETLDELQTIRDVMVAGSAHDYLVSQGITPRWCVVTDPSPVAARYLTTPRKRTKYLIASCCDDAVFKALEGYDVYVWHCYAPDHPHVWEPTDILIGGGCTVGTRALFMALNFGFHDIHLFGFDSCIREEGAHHAYDFAGADEDLGAVRRIWLADATTKGYLVAGYMVAQILELVEIFKNKRGSVDFTVHGSGVVADYVKWLRAKQQSAEGSA